MSATPFQGKSAHARSTLGRRGFLGYLLAGPTLMAAAAVGGSVLSTREANAAIPSGPQPADILDAGDAIILAQAPTAHLVTVQVNADGTATMALPRTEVGQGITTTAAMLIAEEMDLPVSKVVVTLSDSRPELLFNQITGGSTGVRTIYQPVRVAAAVAREQLKATAAAQWTVPALSLTTREGVVSAPDGRTAGYGSLAAAAASTTVTQVSAPLKPDTEFTIIGRPQSRVDAHDIVTGAKRFTMDLEVPGAKPTMVRRPPTINGTVRSVGNLAEVRAMPGVADVVVISTGVAVRGETFGQCVDAVRALNVTWNGGTADAESDDTVLAKLKKSTLPSTPAAPLTGVIDQEFVFAFVSNSALETNCAIADVRADRAEVWASLKTPIYWQQEIARRLGLSTDAVTLHVTQGGGSFGRKLFGDYALEAVEISQKLSKPVKLMWHRTDDFRHGRMHPMSYSRVRATYAHGNVLTYEQRHTEVETDFGHGLGEALTAAVTKLPVGNTALAEGVFELIVTTPYNFGVVTQLLTEVGVKVPTSSMRDVWSPDIKTAQEIVADQLAAKLGKDPYRFRREFLKNDRQRAVLDEVARRGKWGKPMPPGTAQGIAYHDEYRSCSAVLVEIDCRPETVNRPVRDGVTGPRVTKVVAVVDAGLPVNPRGLEAQMIGSVADGIGLALTFGLHLDHGLPLEGSWDNTFYTRQWNMPYDLEVLVLPTTTGTPGGFGEVGVAPAMAATACAYARATGTIPTTFPINHGTLGFEPLPREPSIPQSPTDGLDHAF